MGPFVNRLRPVREGRFGGTFRELALAREGSFGWTFREGLRRSPRPKGQAEARFGRVSGSTHLPTLSLS